MPAKPIAPMPSACQTGRRLKARSSSSGCALAPSIPLGNQIVSSVAVASAISATKANTQRQSITWPSQVASGLPIRMARVSPSITRLIARPRLFGGLIATAVSAATPK